ncbi:MAG: DUF1223 domain-containing protein [Paracoccus sp. (in: a-proteobacteria)]|uniref:DUF1223 domain-containing protein n=1 Tax=Paracoccus sp. TaxID=267 RepID=UPI00391E0459
MNRLCATMLAIAFGLGMGPAWSEGEPSDAAQFEATGQVDRFDAQTAERPMAEDRATEDRTADGDGADDAGAYGAPVIAAPDDLGRMAPGSTAMGHDGGGREGAMLNSFAASDAPAPSMARIPSGGDLPVVVELFTSQGCSSCPPADAMLSMIAQNDDVLALAYHVDYWDYLGWADSFARPEFTARQEAYARAAGERSIYTPQLIIEGRDTALSPGPAQLMGLVDAARFRPAMVSVQREGKGLNGTIELLPLSDLGGRVDITMVRYLPQRQVNMTAGENRGRTVTYSNIVVSLERLAAWDGLAPLRLTVRPVETNGTEFPADTRHALLVQKVQPAYDLPGPILAAIRLD